MWSVDESMRDEVEDFELFCKLSEWSWLLLMASFEENGVRRFEELGHLLVDLRERVLSGLESGHPGMRFLCLEWISRCRKQRREQVLLERLSEKDPFILSEYMDRGIVFSSQQIYSRLVIIINGHEDPFVVATATRHLSFFVDDCNRREIVEILLSVFDREFDVERNHENDQLQHPRDAALYSLEDALGTEFLGTKADGVVAMRAPRRFDLVVESARKLLETGM